MSRAVAVDVDFVDRRMRVGRWLSTITRSDSETASSMSWVMQSIDRCWLAHQPGRVALDQQLGLEVECRERLVEQQHLGIVDQRARQRHALAHAARQRRGIVVGEAVQAKLVQQHAARLRASAAGTPLISSPSITLATAVRQGSSRSFCSM